MSCNLSNSYLVLQPNWNEVLWQSGGKAWAYIKHPQQPTIHADIINLDESDTNFHVTEGFFVKKIDKNSIFLEHAQQKVAVTSLDISVGGGLGVSSGRDETLVIWDTKTGNVRRKLDGHFGEVECSKFFPSGMVVLSGGMDTQLKIWSAEDGSCASFSDKIFLRTLNGHHKRAVRCIAVVDKGKNVVSCSADGSVRLWDCGSSLQIACLAEGKEEINCCAIATGTPKLLETFDYNADKDISRSDLECATENKILIIGSESGFLEGYHIANRSNVFTKQLSSAVNCCCFINSQLVAVGCHDGSVNVIDLTLASLPMVTDRGTESPVLALHPSSTANYELSFWVGFGNGRCSLMQVSKPTGSGDNAEEQHIKAAIELTGPDCDSVYQVVESRDSFVYTACRDGLIRKYKPS